MNTDRVILLVEDSDADAELTGLAFAEAGIEHTLFRVSSGQEALDYLFAQGSFASRDAGNLPAMVLLDLNMPQISGIEVLQAIRADERTKHLPVVMLTTSVEEKDRLSAYESQVNSYVQKPMDYDRFVFVSRQLGLYWLLLNNTSTQVSGM